MTPYYYSQVPQYLLRQFVAVRSSCDNLSNILSLTEIINHCSYDQVVRKPTDFDVAIFAGEICRALIKKSDGFFSMSLPFHIIDEGDRLCFNIDKVKERADGRMISLFRNAIATINERGYISPDELILSWSEAFNVDLPTAMDYCEALISILTEDHGYFRFDDDPKNENGRVHPRFHFDFFYKNTSSLKLGSHGPVNIDFFHSIFDGGREKPFLG